MITHGPYILMTTSRGHSPPNVFISNSDYVEGLSTETNQLNKSTAKKNAAPNINFPKKVLRREGTGPILGPWARPMGPMAHIWAQGPY